MLIATKHNSHKSQTVQEVEINKEGTWYHSWETLILSLNKEQQGNTLNQRPYHFDLPNYCSLSLLFIEYQRWVHVHQTQNMTTKWEDLKVDFLSELDGLLWGFAREHGTRFECVSILKNLRATLTTQCIMIRVHTNLIRDFLFHKFHKNSFALVSCWCYYCIYCDN